MHVCGCACGRHGAKVPTSGAAGEETSLLGDEKPSGTRIVSTEYTSPQYDAPGLRPVVLPAQHGWSVGGRATS